MALGSNVGDRQQFLRHAIDDLSSFVDQLRASTFHETDPVGVVDQPRFLNAAVAGVTTIEPRAFLARLLAIEERFGRERPYAGAPRTLDLDLLLYGDAVIDEPGLIVPHPRFRERRFVLAPLAEIAADWVDPVTRKTVAELLTALQSL